MRLAGVRAPLPRAPALRVAACRRANGDRLQRRRRRVIARVGIRIAGGHDLLQVRGRLYCMRLKID